jgi:hypothetical protein
MTSQCVHARNLTVQFLSDFQSPAVAMEVRRSATTNSVTSPELMDITNNNGTSRLASRAVSSFTVCGD